MYELYRTEVKQSLS